MAIDGMFLRCISREISDTALGGRIEKIYQPSRDEIIIVIRLRSGSVKLLVSANAGCPRIHFTESNIENPQTPPMFCMLMRKKLSGGKLISVRQPGLERVIYLDFETHDELGDASTATVACEIMGRCSNIILIDKNGKITDSIKRVSSESSSVRQILPGLTYSAPPLQNNKSDPSLVSVGNITDKIPSLPQDTAVSDAILSLTQGISPLVAREIEYTLKTDRVRELDPLKIHDLKTRISNLVNVVTAGTPFPTALINTDGIPKDFSFIDINQYGKLMTKKTYRSCSELLDSFYRDRSSSDRMKQRSHELKKNVSNLLSRIYRKIEIQKKELADTENRESLRIFGDILSSNLFSFSKGDKSVTLFNFYDNSDVTIPLDPKLNPQQNAQKYYSDYKKACNAEKILTELILNEETEIQYIESILDLISRASSDAEISSIREELMSQGYIKNRKASSSQSKKLPPLKYVSSDGFTILSGRNNLQNDRLSLKDSRPDDLWLHTQNIHGSHTVIVRNNAPSIPNSTIEQAAIIAAYNSKARNSVNVPVDVTPIKYVRKAANAKPGMVLYDKYRTVFVSPDSDLVAKLLSK